jgi:hypothetical protein
MFYVGLIAFISSADANNPLSTPGVDLVITEIMPNPTQVNQYRGEYIEVYNNSGFDVDLNGLIFNSSNEAGFTIGESLIITDGSYIALGAESDSSLNGGMTTISFEYNYNTFAFGNYEVITISDGSTTFDSVSYGINTHPVVAGKSMILDNDKLTTIGNDTGGNWCPSSTDIGLGDLGTPGVVNDECQSIENLSVGDLIITEIMSNPSAVSQGAGSGLKSTIPHQTTSI